MTEDAADQTKHFAAAFVCKTLHKAMTLWLRYDFRKFTVHTILLREIQRKKIDILMFNSVFSAT